jgi:hypothetical protein
MESGCCCLTTALGLMKLLSPDSANACIRSSGIGTDDVTAKSRALDSVIAQNAKVVDSVGSMLDCTCSSDGYILTTFFLVTLKALAWYLAAVRTPSMLTLPTKVGSYQINSGKDSNRMAAQVVMSELPRMQGIVNRFSQQVKLHTGVAASCGIGSTIYSSGDSESGTSIGSPLSTNMLTRLEMELRQQLRAVRQEVVERLQQG